MVPEFLRVTALFLLLALTGSSLVVIDGDCPGPAHCVSNGKKYLNEFNKYWLNFKQNSGKQSSEWCHDNGFHYRVWSEVALGKMRGLFQFSIFSEKLGVNGLRNMKEVADQVNKETEFMLEHWIPPLLYSRTFNMLAMESDRKFGILENASYPAVEETARWLTTRCIDVEVFLARYRENILSKVKNRFQLSFGPDVKPSFSPGVAVNQVQYFDTLMVHNKQWRVTMDEIADQCRQDLKEELQEFATTGCLTTTAKLNCEFAGVQCGQEGPSEVAVDKSPASMQDISSILHSEDVNKLRKSLHISDVSWESMYKSCGSILNACQDHNYQLASRSSLHEAGRFSFWWQVAFPLAMIGGVIIAVFIGFEVFFRRAQLRRQFNRDRSVNNLLCTSITGWQPSSSTAPFTSNPENTTELQLQLDRSINNLFATSITGWQPSSSTAPVTSNPENITELQLQ